MIEFIRKAAQEARTFEDAINSVRELEDAPIAKTYENAKLANIIPFIEDKCWYLKLIYKYEDKNGRHTVVIPKAAIPFEQRGLPSISRLYPYCYKLLERPYINCHKFLEHPYINCNDSMLLYESVCDLASERGIKEPNYCFDIITEYALREMTLDEIEKELGYKVKVINKENNND